jgi:hypothetical protein
MARANAPPNTCKVRGLLSGLILRGPSKLAEMVKLILDNWAMEPLTGFLESILEAEFKGDWPPSIKLARPRQLEP